MDDHRFDSLAESASRAPSRRQLLRLLGGGGLVAGLGAAVGRAPAPVSAASAECILDFAGAVRLGPSAGLLLDGGTTAGELRGQLRFTLGKSGSIAKGELRLPDGSSVAATGRAAGQALTVRLELPNKQVIVAVGVSSHDLTACQGTADGLLTGPSHGDLGDWHGGLSKVAATEATATAGGNATTSVTGDGAGSGNVAATQASIAEPASTDALTAEPTAMTTSTPEPTATTTTRLLCSLGHVACGDVCIDPTSDVNNCGSCGNVCPAGQAGDVAACVAGVCAVTPACSSGLTLCNSGCVDLTSDHGNCGGCDNMCGTDRIRTDLVCAGGQCVCPADMIACGGCFDPATSKLNCGSCGHACAVDQTCVNGACAGGQCVCPPDHINCGGECFGGKICP